MSKVLHKYQIRVIMLLTAVIFILGCGVAYTLSGRRTSADVLPAGAETAPHEKVRDARLSANERIAWETNLGGSGDEQPVALIEKGNYIYVFGNTSSSDFDFAGAAPGKTRGFAARLTYSGRSVDFTVFDFTIAKVLPTLGGFAVAGGEGSVAGLYILTDSLTVSGSAQMPALHALEACALYTYDNMYFLYAYSHDEVAEKSSLLLHVYSADLRLICETVFTHTYSLKLLDMMPYGDGFLLAAAATYQNLGLLTLARFTVRSQPAYEDIDLGYAYTPTAFVPLSDGFAASCDRGGNCELLFLDSKLRKTDVKFLTSVANSNAKTIMYASATLAYDGQSIAEISDERRIVGTVPYAPQKVTDFGSSEVAAFVIGTTDEGLSVLMLGRQKIDTLNLSVASPARALISVGADCIYVLSDSHGATSDCAANFGGSDIWLSKILL